jgi:polyisoprenoid-binding protein YceI
MLGDDHLISLAHFSGTAQLLDGKPWWVRMLGEAASLTVLDPWASTSERREVADTMLGPSQLDVKHYPSIKLRSSSILPGQQSAYWRLLADVTLHGVTQRVEFRLDCQQTGDRLRVRGKKDLCLRDFNIQPISRALGAFKVKNEFEVTYDITLERKP